jgi:hypothetical protein
MVENFVAIELANINSKNPDFHKDAAVVPISRCDQDVQAGPGVRKREKRNSPWVKTVSSIYYFLEHIFEKKLLY